MKPFKNVLLAIYIIIEMLAIIFFLIKEISAITFVLLTISMSLMIALFFMDRNKAKRKIDS